MVNCISNPASGSIYSTAMEQLPWMFHKHLKLTTPKSDFFFFVSSNCPYCVSILSEWFSQTYRLPESVSCSVVSDSLQPHGLQPTSLLWDSPGKNTGVGSHSLLQGIFPTQGLNPGVLDCRHSLPFEPPDYLLKHWF